MPYQVATKRIISARRFGQADGGGLLCWSGESRTWSGDPVSVAEAERLCLSGRGLRPHPEMSLVFPEDNDLFVVAVIHAVLGAGLVWLEPPDETMFDWTEPVGGV